jgi:hypothetical protein
MVFLFLAGVGFPELIILLVPVLVGVFFLTKAVLRRKSKTLSLAQKNIIAMIITVIASPFVAAILMGLIVGAFMLFS